MRRAQKRVLPLSAHPNHTDDNHMKRKIIVTDELGFLLEDKDSFLYKEFFEPFVARSAEEALEIHRTVGADVIIVDIDLPLMGGDKLCSAVREDGQLKRAYIALICSGKKADISRCGRAGANGYVKRPIVPKELFDRISRALGIQERGHRRILIKVSVLGTYQSESFYCTSRDLSLSGILIETDRSLARGDHLSCSFFLPDLDRVEAKGKVVRVAKSNDPESDGRFLYGMEFRELSDSVHRVIETFISADLASHREVTH